MSLSGDHDVSLVEDEHDDLLQVEEPVFQAPVEDLWQETIMQL